MSFPQDLDRCVTVFKAQKDDTDQPWVYVGKQRAHYKTIHGKKDSSIKHPWKIVFCKYINKGFSVSSIPHILYCKSFNRPPGAYFFQAHEIREGSWGSNFFRWKKGCLLQRKYLFKGRP